MSDAKTHTSPDAPVEIAGAGPAGLAAAITLAHAGRQAVVHETHKEVGHRFGGVAIMANWGDKP
ncbi:MAG: FAD-binding protein [Candidatus Polarisedimenticolaceae bacterium]|nr:FAD-binding protein [Candidatus Polarisedimenticolaceae bacterium]